MERRRPHSLPLLLAAVLFWAASPAHAVVQTMLGDQDFNDGDVEGSIGAYNSAQMGEPAPFNGFIGNDSMAGATFSAQWTHNFDPADFASDEFEDEFGDPVFGFNFFSIEMGLFDHDTDAPGSQLEAFTINGVDVSPLAEHYFENGTPDDDTTTFDTMPAGENTMYNIYRFIFDVDDDLDGMNGRPATADMAADIAATSEFQNGELNVLLALREPSLVIDPDPNTGNGAGIDYSLLRINTPAGDDFPPRLIPEPATATLGLVGLAALAARTRRRR